MATLGNGTVWKSDASLDQKFVLRHSERQGTNWSDEIRPGSRVHLQVQTRRTPSVTPTARPNGWQPDPDQFVIYTRH